MSKERSFNQRMVEHRRQIQRAKRLAAENMIANGILSMNTSEKVSSGFSESNVSFRKVMLERQRALDQAVHTNRSNVGHAILRVNETERRRLEQRLKQLEKEQGLTKSRLNQNKRLMKFERYPILTSSLTKTVYTLKNEQQGKVSVSLPVKVGYIEKLTPSRKARIDTPDYVPEVELYSAEPTEAAIFRVHPAKQVLKRATSVESTEMRSRYQEQEREILEREIKTERRFLFLERVLNKDQDKFRLKMVNEGIPKIKKKDKETDTAGKRNQTRFATLEEEEVSRRAKKEALDEIMSRYPFKKSYFHRLEEQELNFLD